MAGRLIGFKTAGAIGLAGIALGVATWRGRLAIDHLATLGPSSCFSVGLFAGLATALVAVGWRPRAPSRLGIGLRGRRIVLEPAVEPARELPAFAQRALLVAAFGCVGLAVFTNPGTARLVSLPERASEPSAGEFCRVPAPATDEPAAPKPPPRPVEIPGCALVKRAVALGYAKSLGSCAPKDAPVAVKTAIAERAPCTLRQVDEPYLHYAWRRLAGAGGAIAGSNPIDAIEDGVDAKRTQLDHLDTIVATQRHSVSGTPHAAHHVFVALPDPHPGSWVGDLLDPPRCDARYADLPLWPPAGASAGAVVDHVIGQLLFTARFGTTASCRDYTIHWNAPATACDELRAGATAFLDRHDALASVRAVLDRRRRRIEHAALDAELGKKTPPPPPEARTVVSFACFAVDPTATAPAVTGGDLVLDGEPVSVRAIRVPALAPTGAGVLAIYDQLATLLGGEATGPAVVEPVVGGPTPAGEPVIVVEPAPGAGDLTAPDYRLVRLDRLHDLDPFTGPRWPLDRPDLLEVYPLARQLRTFVDAFRRRYQAQRGRL